MSDPGSGSWTPPPPNQEWSGQPPPNQQWSNQPPYGGWHPVPAGPAPLHLPQYDATIGQAASRLWRKFAVFSGRASRSEYWWWALIAFVISLVLQFVGTLAFGGGFFLDPTGTSLDLRQALLPLAPSLVWSLATLVPSLAVTVRRLHDTNRTGWWYLLVLPALAAWPPLLIGLASLDADRLAAGDVSGVAVGALIGGAVLSLIGGIGGLVVLIFCILGPDPRGARFDSS
ncbi:MAG TPA: DUF805 domain-containing protein [Microlunatus sp.]